MLALESVVQFFALSDALINLSASQIIVGAPLRFLIYLPGTGLPTMFSFKS